MVDYKLIGARIKKMRINSKMTQEYVSEKAGITTVYLSKIENGKVKPTIDTLANICDIINCDIGSVLLNSVSESDQYQNETIVRLFRACSADVKPIAINLIEQLSKL